MHVAQNVEYHKVELNIILTRAYKHIRACPTYCQSAGSAKALFVPWFAFPKSKLPSESRTCTTQRQTGNAREERRHDNWPTVRMRYKYRGHASSPSMERAVDVCQYIRESAFIRTFGCWALGNTRNHKHAPVASLRTTASSWCYGTIVSSQLQQLRSLPGAAATTCCRSMGTKKGGNDVAWKVRGTTT